MHLFKELPCQNYDAINQQLLDWVNNTTLVESNNFWNPVEVKEILSSCPLFKQWLVDNKLLIKAVAVTVGKSVTCCGPHIDTQPARYKLSWPILNTKNTFNRWYKIIDESKYTINNLGGKIYSLDNLEEIASNEVLRPMIIDAGVVHDVYIIDGVFPRLGLQCQLFKEPETL